MARLGLDTALVTALGNDANGELLRRACDAVGVGLSMALTSVAPTGSYLAVLDETAELVTAINDMRAMDALGVAHLERHEQELAAADMLVADCNLSAICLDWLCRFSADRGVPLLVEPVSVPKAMKLLAFARRKPVFAITPNAQQLAASAAAASPNCTVWASPMWCCTAAARGPLRRTA
jgi:pseudouridine kinase